MIYMYSMWHLPTWALLFLAQLNEIPASQVCISVSFLSKNLKYDIFFKSFYHAACNLKQYHRRTLTCFINAMCILTILCLISLIIIVKEFHEIHVLYLVHHIYAITLHMFSASICHCWVCGPVTIILLLNMTVHMVSSGHKLSCLVCECITLLCCCDNHGLWIYCIHVFVPCSWYVYELFPQSSDVFTCNEMYNMRAI